MAGIYLTGFEIPRYGITVSIRGDGRVTTEFGEQVIGRAISVKDHGDLIDQDEYRDDFMSRVYELCADDSDNFRANAIIDCFDSAPVIIPSEKGGTDA